ncbi:MAG: 50S ribosomal protein L21e [Candidatus Micrarchaeia archaeon]
MKRSHSKYSKQGRNLKSKGRRPITHQLKTLEVGDLVRIDVDPRFAAGMPHLRFNHRSGFIKAKRGKAYEVQFNDGNKAKILLMTNVHLKKLTATAKMEQTEAKVATAAKKIGKK